MLLCNNGLSSSFREKKGFARRYISVWWSCYWE